MQINFPFMSYVSCKLSNFVSSLNFYPFLAEGFSFRQLSSKNCKSSPSSRHSSVSYGACTESDQRQLATTRWEGTLKCAEEEQLCRLREVKSSVLEWKCFTLGFPFGTRPEVCTVIPRLQRRLGFKNSPPPAKSLNFFFLYTNVF